MSLFSHVQPDGELAVTTLAPESGGRIIVPEAQLLFEADFQRAGDDLYLMNKGEETLRIADYFSSDFPVNIHAANGAMLSGDVVARLAGPLAPGQYAQAGAKVAAQAIGQVEILSGDSSVQRADGTIEILAVGKKIFENDVLQTGSDSTLSVTFTDGTIFSLTANSRMIIDYLVYDPASTSNSGSFNLVQGGFVFIAGQVAKTGGMDVSTPSATMGIRGTTVIADIQATHGVLTTEVSLTRDPDGSVGEIVLHDLDGNIVANITGIESKWVVTTAGEAFEVTRSLQDDADDNFLLAEAVDAFRSAIARVDSGETFVTFGETRGDRDRGGPNTGPGNGLELDSVDEPGGIDPGETPELEDQVDENAPFDEGRLRNDDEFLAPDTAVTGLEDPSAGVINGIVPLENVDVSALDFVILQGPSNGTASISQDGSFEYMPTPNFNGEDQFTYRVTGADGIDSSGTVTIELVPVNDVPVFNDSAISVDEDGTITGVLTATDVDGETLSYSLDGPAADGGVVLLANGTYKYTPNPDFSGADSFSVRATDPAGASVVATVSVQVDAINDGPRVVQASSVVAEDVSEATPEIVGGMLTAQDADIGDTLTWSGSATGAYGVFAISAAGVWSYTLNAADADPLVEGEIAFDRFLATVTDSDGATDTQEITVTIRGANDAPRITTVLGGDEGFVTEGIDIPSATGQLSATDPDTGAVVTWRGGATGTYGTFEITENGQWTYTLNTSAETLSIGDVETEIFDVFVSDGQGAEVRQFVTIEVTGTNQSPMVRGTTIFEAVQDTSLTGQLIATDAETLGPDLTFAIGSNGPTQGDVVINTDGSFEYTPAEGFQGLDRFEYTVTDADGAVTTARVEVEVESEAGSGGNGRTVTLEINNDATDTAAAGSVTITTAQANSNSINLSIAMDRSGSIGEAGWEDQVDAVLEALQNLARTFEGAATQVTVQVITYATTTISFGPVDFQDLDLARSTLIDSYEGGSTRWDRALTEAQGFFDSQKPNPGTETNYLFFITDGEPTEPPDLPVDQTWRALSEELRGDGYSVLIEAFGIGPAYDTENPPQDLTDLAGATPTFLADASLLTTALEASPVFNPTLIDFELNLQVDGGNLQVIADENSAAFATEALEYEVALAEIADIYMLLGENNRFSATAQFDLDGDPETSEIELFSTEVLGVAATAQNIDGMSESDLLFGSQEGDQISGGGGNDLIIGFGGADTLNGGTGLDTILAGEGDDLIVVSEIPIETGARIDGGGGRDILKVGTAGNIDGDVLSLLDLSGIEVLDFENGQTNSFNVVTLADVFDLSGPADQEIADLLNGPATTNVSIYGDTEDSVELENTATTQFVHAEGVTVDDVNGTQMDIYQYFGNGALLATLSIDAEVEVTVATA